MDKGAPVAAQNPIRTNPPGWGQADKHEPYHHHAQAKNTPFSPENRRRGIDPHFHVPDLISKDKFFVQIHWTKFIKMGYKSSTKLDCPSPAAIHYYSNKTSPSGKLGE